MPALLGEAARSISLREAVDASSTKTTSCFLFLVFCGIALLVERATTPLAAELTARGMPCARTAVLSRCSDVRSHLHTMI